MRERFLSPLGVPCQAPPFGTLTAVDLKTHQLVWQLPVGTVEDTGPMGIRMGLPLPSVCQRLDQHLRPNLALCSLQERKTSTPRI